MKSGFCIGLALVAASAWPAPGDTGLGHRSSALTLPAGGKPGFLRLPSSATGIAFTNSISIDRHTTNQIYLNGSGVAAGDVDGDGWCDLFFAGLGGQSRLYRNSGQWTFRDATRDSGLACDGVDATGAAFADLDGDGDLDLVLNSVGSGTWIFINDGKGHFTRQTVLNPGRCGASLALADIDGDGDLDLYIANYRLVTMRDEPNAPFRVNRDSGRTVILQYKGRSVTQPDLVGRFSVTEGRITENGEVDVLYRNDGKGRFTALSFTDGTFLDEEGRPLSESPYDWGLSVMMRDINGDGAPDIYVCNDFISPDRVWLNDGRGKFHAMPRTRIRHTSMFSMGIDFADIDRDGFDDFFVVDMLARGHVGRHVQIGGVPPYEAGVGRIDDRPQVAHNTLFKQRDDGSFVEMAWLAGVEGTDWSWAPIFLDVDLDGYEDLLIATGHERDAMNADVMERADQTKKQQKLSDRQLLELNHLFARFNAPNYAFRNRGDLSFEDVSEAWGFNTAGVSQGMCLADLDNDGDLDVVMNNLNGEAGVYRNEANGPRVAVRLKGKPANTGGVGAKIRVLGGPVAQSQEMICGGRYLSGDEGMRVFAAGSMTNRLSIEVTWRSGKRSVVGDVRPNRLYEIAEEGAEEVRQPGPAPTPWFTDESARLGHRHHEEPFDDFARQPLLPWRLSQWGPGVAWHDVDGDGREDLIIGSGKGGTLGVYHNEGNGAWRRDSLGPLGKVVSRDQAGIVGMGSVLLVGSANYEDGLTNGGWVRVYDLARGVSGESVLGPEASTGPLALGDVDGDGDLDLFVGGRGKAGRYPEPAPSLLLRNEEARFVGAQKWDQMGLVSGAVLSDLDGDGWLDLVVACEWGALRIFRNKQGRFEEWNAPVSFGSERRTLNQLRGWWHGVTTGDIDGDGRLDIVASNWGRNSKYRANEQRPWKLYFGDLKGTGEVDLIEARPELKKEVPERGWRMVRAALPFLQERISSYQMYGQASVEELYGPRLKTLSHVEVNTTASGVLLNRGDRFEWVELPAPAQWSPAFGVCVADADGDGAEDIFLSQNFFAMNPESGRQDGGRGLWIRNDGHGGLSAMSGAQSGIEVYGEQRGCAVADYDGDGRVDLVISQNGGPTRLYRNRAAKPGLRVRLKGGPGNATAVGAALRLVYATSQGPLRELHAGSGYLSQDGAVQVLGMREKPTGLWVRWPGGREQTVTLPGGAREVELSAEGPLKVIP